MRPYEDRFFPPHGPSALRTAACNALASPAHLSAEWLSYGRNVMRPQLAPRCGVAFLIISCPLVARIAVRVGPRTAAIRAR